MDLELVNLTAPKLLNAITRSTRARYRYVYDCADKNVRIDVVIEHQLTNHMLLLQDLAQAAGIDSEDVVEAMQAGSKQAHEER